MKVLVTGASGFVGSWMARELIQRGHDVRILARPSSDLSELEGFNFEICHGDITDPESLDRAFKNIDSVFHLAGYIGYTKTARSLMEQVNVLGTQNVVEACKKNQTRRLIHMSSVVAVGAAYKGDPPLTEKSPYTLSHLNLGYFETKRKAEIIVRSAVERGELDAVILNPSTIYGAGDAKKGSRGVQLKVARGQMPFYTSGGVSIVYAKDVVEATYHAWQTGKSGERYILSGENITIKELFTMIAEAANVKPPSLFLPDPVVFALGKIGDRLERWGKRGPLNSETAWTSTLYHWFDSSKAQKELGLKVTPARQCIAESVGWMKSSGLI